MPSRECFCEGQILYLSWVEWSQVASARISSDGQRDEMGNWWKQIFLIHPYSLLFIYHCFTSIHNIILCNIMQCLFIYLQMVIFARLLLKLVNIYLFKLILLFTFKTLKSVLCCTFFVPNIIYGQLAINSTIDIC